MDLDLGDASAPVQARSSRPLAEEPQSIPEDLLQPKGGIRAAAYAKTGRGVSDEDTDPPARKAQRTRRAVAGSPSPANRAREVSQPTESDSSDTPPSADGDQPETSTQPQRRPTWRDLGISPDGVPIDESVHRTSGEARTDDQDPVRLANRDGDDLIAHQDKPARVRLSSATLPVAVNDLPRPSISGESTCDIDPTDRRVIDFQLPGLDGKMVSFRDFDADVIVLDFWGSWCVQCRKSIAFEQELLAKLGSKRVKVIGIACEKGATLEERRASAAKATRQLGINYPVLVSSMDGTCPLQKAFQVQFYPTLVVLDREGRILHVERGATDATLGRTGRTVVSALQDADSRVE